MLDSAINPATATGGGALGLQVYLAVDDAAAAIDFYRRALGAIEQFRVVGDDGRIGHAELTLGPITLMLSDEYPEIGVRSPASLGGSGVALYLVVGNCDAVHATAVEAGATTLRPPEDQAHGNRTATVLDPFGHRWMLSQPLEPFDLQTYAEREGGGFRVEAAGRDPGAGRGVEISPVPLWPCINCVDARATISLLVQTFGFEERLVVADEGDPSVVEHAELRWPHGGGVMLGSAGRHASEYGAMPTGAASCYLVAPAVDELWERALSAGLHVVSEIRDEDHGGRGFAVRDREGNIWSFGTYGGA
jgi:uncharacterized glyoxalase superfamily protein PhnB